MSDISKITLPNNETYEIKDEYVRHIINVLLGIEEPEQNEKTVTEK